MRLTIATKLWSAFGTLILILVVAGLMIEGNITQIGDAVTEIRTVAEPISAAAYEMEINAIGMGLGLLRYLETRNPQYRARVEKDARDFERFKAQYDRLAATPQGQTLGERAGRLYEAYKALGDILMHHKDVQERLFATIGRNFEKIDMILDEHIQANIERGGPEGLNKVEVSLELELQPAEVGTWLGHYLRTPQREYRERIYDNVNDFQEQLRRFTSLPLTAGEKHWASELEQLFHQTVSSIAEVLETNDVLQEHLKQFLDLGVELDDLLDDEIRVLTHHDLHIAKAIVHQTLGRVQVFIMIVLVVTLVIGTGTAFTISTGIVRSVHNLVEGANKIGSGLLDHRIEVTTQDEIGALTLAFNRMTEKLQEEEEARRRVYAELEMRVQERTAELVRSNAELQQFAYVASHDLQEPLRMVGSYVQLLERRYRGKLDAEADEFIAYARDGAARMQQLINDLLAYARVGHQAKPFEPTDCSVILSHVLLHLQVAIAETGTVVTYDALPTVMGDAIQLLQVWQNLVSNAIKFRSEASPRVHVSATLQGKEWVFAVRDNGIGIDPRHAARIFRVFQRLHTASEYPGTGIGLALCQKIVEHHGGRIWVDSQPGKGATFFFAIPFIH